MNIIIACGSMQFGPRTLLYKSLGGSETAALSFARAVAARGHKVTMFCNLPPRGEPDFCASGSVEDGVRFVALESFAAFATTNRHDLLIAVRDPQLVALPTLSRKKVLWAHDIFTKRGMQRALEQMQFTFNEIWCVSEWHRHQIHDATGYPLERIVALRNGIVKYDDLPVSQTRESKTLLFAARPERGLDNLIRPGGIMDNLPDYKLLVAMYEHFPEHMRDYYTQIFARMKAMSNVEFIGGKPNGELRALMASVTAYIYPTQFEETSCIIARECIEQGTPFLTTCVGALSETLQGCGMFFEEWLHQQGIAEPERGSDGWNKLFAMFVREALESSQQGLEIIRNRMRFRKDLYWDGVAELAEPHFAAPEVSAYSRAYSLIKDGDVIAAKAFVQELFPPERESPEIQSISDELAIYDRMLAGDMAKYYDGIYEHKDEGEEELVFSTENNGQRWRAIADEIAKLPPGSCVLEFGCGAGHVLVPLAARFPNIQFLGYDFSAVAVDFVASKCGDIKNIGFTTEKPPSSDYDAVICSETLEHVERPWELLKEVESYARAGGRVILTTPFGAWEPETYERRGKWHARAHLWEIDQTMFKQMVGEKPNERTILVLAAVPDDQRPIGNLIFSYDADHAPINAVDPLEKAMRHHARETCTACVIAYNNEDTIVRMLNSIDRQVAWVSIALGPCTDRTPQIIEQWFEERPRMSYSIIDVPKIEPWKFGFDDARMASIQGVQTEWIIWIDTDEYLSGDFRKYLRDSSLDAYLIAQHHFTCVPRGNPPEIDRPARLMRTDRKFACQGHIHEHFEIPEGGPGRAFLLPDVDIGHGGYVNEDVRRGRFMRNFPFLEWDHQTEGAQRKLHHFLWFRDIIHRMRFANDPDQQRKLAKEAVQYYNDWQTEMGTFGPGLFMSLTYLAEANTVLGIGVPLSVTVKMDDRNAILQGRFESYDQLERVFKQLLTDEFKDRTSRYY